MPANLAVKLIPGLSIAALKAKRDKELALWYELRAINVTGCGSLVLNDAVAALVCSFGYSVPTAYRLLRAGHGQLWDIVSPSPATRAKHSYSDVPTGSLGKGQSYFSIKTPSSVIKIYGLFRVAEWFNISAVGRPVEVKASDFRGRGTKRAWLYASFHKPEECPANPMSRHSITVATSTPRRQQQRYDKAARVKRVANFAFAQDGNKMAPILDLVTGKSKQWTVVRRLGNTYHSRALKAHVGMTKKINSEFRQRSLIRGEARLPTRFFMSARSLISSPVRDEEAFVLVGHQDRLIKGRMEWCLV